MVGSSATVVGFLSPPDAAQRASAALISPRRGRRNSSAAFNAGGRGEANDMLERFNTLVILAYGLAFVIRGA